MPSEMASAIEQKHHKNLEPRKGSSINDQFNRQLLQKARSLSNIPRSRVNFDAAGPVNQPSVLELNSRKDQVLNAASGSKKVFETLKTIESI